MLGNKFIVYHVNQFKKARFTKFNETGTFWSYQLTP